MPIFLRRFGRPTATVLLALLVLTPWGHAAVARQQVQVIRRAVIREGPKGTAAPIKRVEEGRFDLISPQTVNHWYKIRVDDREGWIYSGSVRVVSSGPSTIKLSSFNTLHLGWGTTKHLESLAMIMAQYDLIALLEVMRNPRLDDVEGELERLTDADWTWIHSDLIGRTTYRERYAYLWRTDRVAQIPGSAFVVPDEEDHFIRAPYIADFRAGHFDFTVIAVHLIYGQQAECALCAFARDQTGWGFPLWDRPHALLEKRCICQRVYRGLPSFFW